MNKHNLSSLTRRRFLNRIGGATATTLTAALVGSPSLALGQSNISEALAATGRHGGHLQRAQQAYLIRHHAALYQRSRPFPIHSTNGDELRFENRIGNYSKALPHNQLGEVDRDAYQALVRALRTGRPADFASIPAGGPIKQANPQAAFAFLLEGADSHHLGIDVPPAFDSEDTAAEMSELYWQAITRDIPFAHYPTDATIAAAVEDLSRFSRFRSITAATLFRGTTPGDLTGPYISQLLLKDVPYGAGTITQRYRVPMTGDDHLTMYQSWLDVQNGVPPLVGINLDPTPRYLRTSRDLAEWDHRDFTYQGFLNAALILLSYGRAALAPANPYRSSPNQSGFATFGAPHVLDLVARVANCALKAAWFQKWVVHRRLRPEEFGGRVHNQMTGAASYPINAKLLSSPVLAASSSRFGSYLLPMAYPEGSPTHPAYPAGHAAIAGACTTMLKAFFDESFAIPNPVEASDDGLKLEPYSGETLRVGGELNKLAANVAVGRDAAGVHWRSDGDGGLRLGEEVAIQILTDMKGCFNEEFSSFSLTRFDGTQMEI